jgi:phage anti-repressor protein
MDASLNIVDLIENNPITRLSNTYQHKLLNKIKANFTDNEQHIFVASFYCYLKHDSCKDFVIDLDNVWRWLEFYTKQKAKDLLEKYFTLDKDYIKLLTPQGKQNNETRGGHNKETFMLTIDTFKKFCLKAGTKKADDIHDYYLKLEKTLHEVLEEESSELKLQIEQKNNALATQVITSEKEKERLREKTILEHFPKNTQCVYYGLIDDLGANQEKLIKFGNSNDLRVRVRAHKETYTNFRLVNAFKVDNKFQIENALKGHPVFTERLRPLTLQNKKYVEILHMESLALPELDKLFREIIMQVEFSPDNYMKILEENKALKKQIAEIQATNHLNELILVKADNERLQVENLKLIKKYNTLQGATSTPHTNQVTELLANYTLPPPPTPVALLKPNAVLSTFKKNIRNKQGTYTIDGLDYQKNEGTRQEVWDGIAYQTSGLLKKHDLILNKNGKLISKKKCIAAAVQNHLETYNASR